MHASLRAWLQFLGSRSVVSPLAWMEWHVRFLMTGGCPAGEKDGKDGDSGDQ